MEVSHTPSRFAPFTYIAKPFFIQDVPEGTEKRSYVVSQLDSLLKSTPQILMLLHEGDLTDTKATALLSGEANVLQVSLLSFLFSCPV